MDKFLNFLFDIDRNGKIDGFEYGLMVNELERECREISSRGRRDDFLFDDDFDEFDEEFDDEYDDEFGDEFYEDF